MDNKELDLEIQKAQTDYYRLGLKWDVGSIRYLIGRGYEGLAKTFNSLRVPDPINTVGLVECAIKDKKKADEIIDKWTTAGHGLALLHMFIVDDLREQGFFKSEREMNLVVHLAAQKKELQEIGTQILTEELITQSKEVQSMMQ